MNIKVNQSEATIMRIISETIRKQAADKKLQEITITAVKLSGDMSHAKVFYTAMNRNNLPKIEEALTKATGFFRSEVAHSLNAKHAPELKFCYDTSIEYGEKIEEVLKSLNN